MCWAAAPDDPTQTRTRRAVVLSAAPRGSEPWYEADDGPRLRYTTPLIVPYRTRTLQISVLIGLKLFPDRSKHSRAIFNLIGYDLDEDV